MKTEMMKIAQEIGITWQDANGNMLRNVADAIAEAQNTFDELSINGDAIRTGMRWVSIGDVAWRSKTVRLMIIKDEENKAHQKLNTMRQLRGDKKIMFLDVDDNSGNTIPQIIED